MNETTRGELVIAEVTRVIMGDKPYAVSTSKHISGSVTFSLDSDHKVWDEGDVPKAGTFVVLGKLRKNASGWRALSARYMRPDDEAKKQ